MADESGDHQSPGSGTRPRPATSRGVGVTMIAAGIAVMALALVFVPAATQWFGYATVAAAGAVGAALVIRGAVLARRASPGPD